MLINSSRKLDPDVPSPSQFDHVITMVPLGKHEVWMDTTTEVAPFRLLSFNLRKKQALMIPADGAPHLEETPADPPMPTATAGTRRQGERTRKAEGSRQVLLQGDTELLHAHDFPPRAAFGVAELLKTISALCGLDGDVSDLKVGDPAATTSPSWSSFKSRTPISWTGPRKSRRSTLPISQINLLDADEDNTDPNGDAIEFGPPGEYDFNWKLEFPRST